MNRDRDYPFISRRIGIRLTPPGKAEERERALNAIGSLRSTAAGIRAGEIYPATKLLPVRRLERGFLEHIQFARCLIEDCLETAGKDYAETQGITSKDIRLEILRRVLNLLNVEINQTRKLMHREVVDLSNAIFNLYPGREKRIWVHATRHVNPDRELHVAQRALDPLEEDGGWDSYELALVYCVWQPDFRYRFTNESAVRIERVADFWEKVWR